MHTHKPNSSKLPSWTVALIVAASVLVGIGIATVQVAANPTPYSHGPHKDWTGKADGASDPGVWANTDLNTNQPTSIHFRGSLDGPHDGVTRFSKISGGDGGDYTATVPGAGPKFTVNMQVKADWKAWTENYNGPDNDTHYKSTVGTMVSLRLWGDGAVVGLHTKSDPANPSSSTDLKLEQEDSSHDDETSAKTETVEVKYTNLILMSYNTIKIEYRAMADVNLSISRGEMTI